MIDVESWLSAGGLVVLAAVVFAVSGLLVGFFLPGDSSADASVWACSNGRGAGCSIPTDGSCYETSRAASCASIAICTRLAASSLRSSRDTWAFTVDSLMKRMAAIWALD